MKNLKWISLLLFFAVSAARADSAILDDGEQKVFTQSDVLQLPPNTISYVHHTVELEQWTGPEAAALNLFSGFKVPDDKPTRMYVVKVSFVINKNAANVNIDQFLQENVLKSIDSTVEQKVFDTAVEKPITYTEASSDFRNPPAPYQWCNKEKGAVCFKSHFVLQKPWNFAFAAYEVNSPYRTVESQSEVRVMKAPAIENLEAIKKLPGLPAIAPTAVMVQNMFWTTHLLRFAKVIGVIQPIDNRALVTAYMAFAIDRRIWDKKISAPGSDKNFEARDVLEGRVRLSRTDGTPIMDGILSGMPDFTKHMANSMSVLLNK